MNKIKESLKQRKQPRVMETRNRRIRVDWKKETHIMPCGFAKREAMSQKELCNEKCGLYAYNTRL